MDIEKKIIEINNLTVDFKSKDQLFRAVDNVSFDIFQGENLPLGKKSVAINVIIQAMDKTLSENDLNEVSQKIIDIVKQKTGGTIRS